MAAAGFLDRSSAPSGEGAGARLSATCLTSAPKQKVKFFGSSRGHQPCSVEYLLFIRCLTTGKRLPIFLEKDSEPNLDQGVLFPERMSDPVRPSPFDTPHRVSARLTQKPLRKSGFFVCAISPSSAAPWIHQGPGRAGIVHKPGGLGVKDRSLAVNWNGVQGNWKQLSGTMQEHWVG